MLGWLVSSPPTDNQQAQRPTAPQSVPRQGYTSTARDLASRSRYDPNVFLVDIMRVRISPIRPTGHNCVICQDPIHGVEVRAPCGHHYDKNCVTDLFEASTRDESLYPPRCCRQPISLSAVQPHLTPAFITLFAEKSREFGTLKRVYCANPSCSRFLGAQNNGWFAGPMTCPAPGCNTRTCAGCKAKIGLSTHVCKASETDKEVLALSKNSGWARCPGCEQMIELHMGCFHMTCRCKTEFCYLCRARWKTCACTQWDERRLLAAAEERVDNQLGAARRQPAARLAPIQERVEQPAAPVQPAVRLQPATRAVPAPLLRPTPAVTQPVRARPNLVNAVHAPAALRRGSARIPKSDDNIPPLEDARPLQSTSTQSHLAWFNSLNPVPVQTPGIRWGTVTDNDNDVPHLEDTAHLHRHSVRRPTSSESNTSAVRSRRVPVTTALRRSTSGEGSASVKRSKTTATQPHPTMPRFDRRPTSFAKFSDRAKLIQEAVEELRVNHDCQHINWKYRQGAGPCQTCHQQLPLYLFVSTPLSFWPEHTKLTLHS